MEYVGQVVASLKDGKTGEPLPRKWDSSVMDLPVVNSKRQRRPTLRVEAINTLVSKSKGEEQALYVLLAATGMRISEALALETRHFVNGGRTIRVCQQVDRDRPRVVEYLKTDAGSREIDLSKQVAESTCEHLLTARMDCCLRPETARLTYTTTLSNVG